MVGYDPGRSRLLLMVVDGRQAPHSVGMTLPEVTSLLEAMGATEALNLDGGGHAVLHPEDSSAHAPEGHGHADLERASRTRLEEARPEGVHHDGGVIASIENVGDGQEGREGYCPRLHL